MLRSAITLKTLPGLALLLTSLFLAGCGKETYGTGVDPSAPVVAVQDIFLQPQLMGKTVTVAGKVYTQCESNGCWFVLQDDTAQIYIDLSTNNFELPPMPGRQVMATGTVTAFQNNLLLIAQGVETR
ncbi:DNA-binding protein [Desulfurivibrio sp. D14AmB]|uniref:DNA-binding protein n=1 Tax=Desulfurivibrio sp. D14AmB TaxID=3374370 RepID=UPI00376EE899